jgi:hypothetical protein
VIVRGFAVCGWLSALRKNRFAAAVSRFALSRKSMVWPRPSTGWMKTVRGQCKTRHRGSAEVV